MASMVKKCCILQFRKLIKIEEIDYAKDMEN